jgi:mRNA-degrading endonuclease RelE of RelBE toxin-antitoxin system
MDAVFVELPPFEQHRSEYLDDTTYSDFQQELMKNPEAGDVIQGTGGLRKVRFKDSSRGKGKRGGIRVIYYWWSGEKEFLLFTVYGKDEVTDLTPKQRQALAVLLKKEKGRRGEKDEKKKPIRRTGRRL